MATDMDDSKEAIARDLAAVSRIGAMSTILSMICRTTGMGFAALARVTDGPWTCCAVKDDIAFGMVPGDQLAIETTLWRAVRDSRTAIVIDHVR